MKEYQRPNSQKTLASKLPENSAKPWRTCNTNPEIEPVLAVTLAEATAARIGADGTNAVSIKPAPSAGVKCALTIFANHCRRTCPSYWRTRTATRRPNQSSNPNLGKNDEFLPNWAVLRATQFHFQLKLRRGLTLF